MGILLNNELDKIKAEAVDNNKSVQKEIKDELIVSEYIYNILFTKDSIISEDELIPFDMFLYGEELIIITKSPLLTGMGMIAKGRYAEFLKSDLIRLQVSKNEK